MRKVSSEGGFHLTILNSSSPDFLILFEPQIKLHPENVQPQNQNVLSLPLNAAIDCYVIESKQLQKIQIKSNVTQRVLITLTASLFDPLGFTAPLIIRLQKV